MNIVYDTSALIALFIDDHPDHEKADDTHLKLLDENVVFHISTHSIAELYSNITKGLRYLDLSAKEADRLINHNITPNFKVLNLTIEDYLAVTEHLAKKKLTGGIVYDGLIAQASQKIDADYIVTLDEGDFIELGGLTDADFINPSKN